MNYYLVDTNIFIHTIKDNIFSVANLCKEKENDMSITPSILKELDPGFYKEKDEPSSKELYTCVCNLSGDICEIIRIVEKTDFDGANVEFKRIRKQFYSWMSDANYLRTLVEKGIIKEDEVKYLKKKDIGECELVAIAKATKGDYWVVTNDLGRVYMHPHLNIFEQYKDDEHVTILAGEEWLGAIGHKTN